MRLVLTVFDLFKQENMLFLCTATAESKPVKQETSSTVIFVVMVSCLWWKDVSICIASTVSCTVCHTWYAVILHLLSKKKDQNLFETVAKMFPYHFELNRFTK